MNELHSIRRTSLVAALLGVTIAACSRAGGSDDARGAGGAPAAVGVATVARHDLVRDVVLIGPVEPLRVIGVNSRATGTILSIRVVEGDRVRPGQLMAELDSRETTAQLERARAVLANARTVYDRSRHMREAEIITDAEFEAARAAFATAGSDVELWETRLEFSRVLAPTAGIVTAKLVEAGSAVTANQRLFDIADDSLLVVRVQMSELDVVRVRPGDSVSVQLDAHPGTELSGRIRRIFPSADPDTRLIPVEVALSRTPARMSVRPGFLARVRFALERRAGALVVPTAAVRAGAGGSFAFVVEADTLTRRSITTGLSSAGVVEIVSGLAPGELVVTSGQLSLRPGARVRVTHAPELPDSLHDRPEASP